MQNTLITVITVPYCVLVLTYSQHRENRPRAEVSSREDTGLALAQRGLQRNDCEHSVIAEMRGGRAGQDKQNIDCECGPLSVPS